MKKKNVILFWFMNDWGLFGRTYEMIARHLPLIPDVGLVLCILPPKIIWNGYYFLPFHLKLESKKLFLLTPNTRMIPKSLVPEAWWSFVNERLRDGIIKILLKIMGFSTSNTILWLFPPHRYINKLLDGIPHRMLVTQIIDNHLHKTNETPKMKSFSEKQYNDLAGKSDVLITSSRQNFDYYSGMNPRCYMFDNALDKRFLHDPTEMPFRKNGNRPRLGYLGWVTQRTDLDLLAYVAKERPSYDIVIAGPHEHGINLKDYGLTDMPNVRIEPPVPYKSVPDFLATLDVCLVPHRDNPYSKAMNPLKIFQYLASGRPIVSTPVAGVERWEGLISIAQDSRDFAEKIDIVLREDRISNATERIKAVSKETWEIRIRQMFDAILKNSPTATA